MEQKEGHLGTPGSKTARPNGQQNISHLQHVHLQRFTHRGQQARRCGGLTLTGASTQHGNRLALCACGAKVQNVCRKARPPAHQRHGRRHSTRRTVAGRQNKFRGIDIGTYNSVHEVADGHDPRRRERLNGEHHQDEEDT